MLSKNALEIIKKRLSIKKYPTADRNASFGRLIFNAIPYLISCRGYSCCPLSVFIHVNTDCNLKCKMCDAGQQDKASMFYKNLVGGQTGIMALEDFKKIIDKIKHFKPFIGIPATEPLMYPHIIQAIEYIRAQDLRCSIATNGTFLESMAEDIIGAGLTKLVVSLDGPPDIHDLIRGVKGTYQKVLRGIRKLEELKIKKHSQEPYVYINYVICEDNYSTIIDFIEGFPLDIVKQVDFRVMFYCTDDIAGKHNKIFGEKYDATSACLSGGINLDKVDTDILHEQITKVTRQHGKICTFFFNHGRDGLRRYYHEPEMFLDATRCVFPWYTMQINTDGSVIPPQRCYHNVFGNILTQDFNEVWNGEKMRAFRRDLRKYGRFPACTRCEGVNF
ncbi:MAG: hypothetical protein COV73_04910 [Candidatus Omnitrophica bacterium CG11_big_fil_rev_8_21_14_0_20_43_6]|nr:MAG: hypothetical protein COV73_04910 [Candidatus Omnitrophica bacterium CG11_big_fil_rev_8_21_14_0_20_43_6]